MNKKTIKTNCPQCGKKDTWKKDNTFKPFCSERCKLIDLGDWASEKHQIPGHNGEAPSELDIPEDQSPST